MYTKTGLGLLAAAGLTFGVIGMQNGGASPATPACAAPSTNGNAATGSAGTGAGHQTTRTTEPNGSKHGNGSGRTAGKGLLSVESSGAPGGGGGTVTVPNPNGGATGEGGTGTSDTFLDLGGGTSGTALPGSQSAPPANAGAVGRSSYIARLLQLNANANTHR